MKQETLQITENLPLTGSVYRMRLGGDISAITTPGQFINLKVDGLFLRRPISVCDAAGDTVTIIYKVVGQGTEKMAAMRPGEALDVLTGLGNGFDVRRAGARPLLIGGGIGAAPLYWLARELRAAGARPTAVMGFNTAEEIYYVNEFAALGVAVVLATADGSRGVRGFVTDAMAGLDSTYFYACGPEPMLRALWKAADTDGQLSFEERMGCGFGACMGCSCKTIAGYKRICRDGPVMEKGEILWDD